MPTFTATPLVCGMLSSEDSQERIQQELEAKELCAWLEFLPLGMELVGDYVDRKASLSLEKMLQRLEKKRLNKRSLPHSSSAGLTHSASSAMAKWGFQLLKQGLEQRNFVSVRKS
ncbi:MAG TPA: hypothetical protein V6C91_00015 [Coleofasciculaceae cyanobacterium]